MIFSTLLYYRVIQIYGCNLVNCRNITFLIFALFFYNIMVATAFGKVYVLPFCLALMFSARSFWFIDIVVSCYLLDIWTLELLPEWMRCGFVVCNTLDRYSQSIWNVFRLYETIMLRKLCILRFIVWMMEDDESFVCVNNAKPLITYLNCFCCRVLLRCRHFEMWSIGCVSICFILHWNE